MRDFGRYGRDYAPRGYDRGWRGGRGGRGYDDPYLREGRGPGFPPYDATGWAPFALTPFAYDPTLGWAGWGAGTAYVPPARPEPRRVDPRESPMYGRGGDRALRRWAERYGYDFEYTIQPRRGPRY